MKITCMTLPYANVPFERALEGISRAGYRYIAFGLPHAGMEVTNGNDPSAVKHLLRQFDHYGVEPVMLIGTNQLAPGKPMEQARLRLEMAKALGIQEVLSLGTWGYRDFPHSPKPREELELQNRLFVEKFRAIAVIAEFLGVTVTIKPHTGNTATAVHMKQTLAQIGSAAVKASYDPGNVQYYEGIRADEDFPAIAEQTTSLIAKDHRGTRANHDFPIPGEGDVNFGALFHTWKSKGLSGSVVVERVDGDLSELIDLEQIDERITKARMNLERLLKKPLREESLSCEQ